LQIENLIREIVAYVFGESMIIGDKKQALVFISILQFDKVFERAQIIAEMQSAGRLNSRNENGFSHTMILIYQFYQ